MTARKQKLIRRIYIYFVLLSLCGLALITWSDVREFRRSYMERTAQGLQNQTLLLRTAMLPLFRSGNLSQADSIVKEIGAGSEVRLTLILPDGKVIADSKADADSMENHTGRPEIHQAIHGSLGISTRHSATVNMDMMYVALPVQEEGKILGVMRASVFLNHIRNGLSVIYHRTLLTVCIALVLIALISFVLSRQISKPIEELEAGAVRLAEGDFSVRLPEGPFEETARLATAMNEMAVQLRQRFQAVVEQKRKQEAMFNSMSEGVMAVDSQATILELNPSAADFLQVGIDQVRGRKTHEVIRNSDLQEFIERTLAGDKPMETEINWKRLQEERFVHVNGTSIKDQDGGSLGGLLVFNDITKLRKLERMRRDFVANVSHELRTPLTSIKGFTEVLLQDGKAMDVEEYRRFLTIMTQQTDRLGALIDDLLTLSRIEDQEEKKGIQLEMLELTGLLQAAHEAVIVQAREKEIAIEIEAPAGLTVRASPLMIEQAVTNLLDNAIKYSPNQSKIRVVGTRDGGLVHISVIDQGIGIEAIHIPHLFERFYRVDKARSRKAGGTGLGLSIVKHIAALHGGRVDVRSAPGKGSTFTLTIPQEPH